MIILSLRDCVLGGELQHTCLRFWGGIMVEEIHREKLHQGGLRV